MHSHLLPGIDDGIKTVEDTVIFMEQLHALGYKKFICTPHILSGVHNNNPETIGKALAIAKEAVKNAGLPVTIEGAAEYMIDPEFEAIIDEGKQLLTFGKNYILIEMSYVASSPNMNEVIFKLQIKGLNPILAHPERYNYYHKNFKAYEDLKDRGLIFQVNLLSLSGYYGKEVKRTAEKLIEAGMVSLIGTDMHHQNHLNATHQYVRTKEFYKLVENLPLINNTLL